MSELPHADLEAALTTLSKLVESPHGRRILRRWIDTRSLLSAGTDAPTGVAAAWRGIAEGAEIIADHAAFLAERAAIMSHLAS